MKTMKSLVAALMLSASLTAIVPAVLTTNTTASTSTSVSPGYTIIRVYINSQGEKMAVLQYSNGTVIHVPARIVGAEDIATCTLG